VISRSRNITNTTISMVFSDLHQKYPSKLAGAASEIVPPHEFTSENVLKITVGSRIKKITKALVEARTALKVIAAGVN